MAKIKIVDPTYVAWCEKSDQKRWSLTHILGTGSGTLCGAGSSWVYEKDPVTGKTITMVVDPETGKKKYVGPKFVGRWETAPKAVKGEAKDCPNRVCMNCQTKWDRNKDRVVEQKVIKSYQEDIEDYFKDAGLAQDKIDMLLKEITSVRQKKRYAGKLYK